MAQYDILDLTAGEWLRASSNSQSLTNGTFQISPHSGSIEFCMNGPLPTRERSGGKVDDGDTKTR